MRFLILLFLHTSIVAPVSGQVICGTVNENENLTLTAPGSNVFISISFASYGTPNGSCGNFTLGSCHASNSASIVGTALIGNNSATIAATNGVFGDPCGGTFKRLYVEAVYGLTLPLKVVTFNGQSTEGLNLLRWQTAHEDQVLHFSVERSEDARQFTSVGTLPANNTAGVHHYSFQDPIKKAGVYFYRLRMLDLDGKFYFSNVIKLSGNDPLSFTVFPNPTTELITLNGLQPNGMIQLLQGNGKLVRQQLVIAQTETLNLHNCPPGIYLIRYTVDNETRIQKIVKQ